MAFSFEVSGMSEVIQQLGKLGDEAPRVAARGLYDGAGVVADKVSQAVQGIATEKFKYAAGGKRRKPSPEEKAIVSGAKHGIAKFQNNGLSIQTSVGYQSAGYASLNGKTKPVPLIANAINSGTSFMQKQPFMRRAFSQSKQAATERIEATIQEEFDKLNID